MSLDPVIAMTLRASIGSLFAYAVAHKIARSQVFLLTLSKYLLGIPLDTDRAVKVAGALVVAIELAVVAGCGVPSWHFVGGMLAAAVLLAYGAAMNHNLLRGNVLLDCGCSWGAHRQPVTRGLIRRNLGLALLGLLIALPVDSRPLSVLDVCSILAACASAALLYLGINLLLAIAPSYQEAS